MREPDLYETADWGTEPCQRAEAALAELVDGTLTPEQVAALRTHAAGCETCRVLLTGAADGKRWLQFLHDAPPPIPRDLTAKILARTSAHPIHGAAEPQGMHGVPAAIGASLAPVWAISGSRQNRWLMTAAMAFFSIAATLSVAGVHASDLTPQAVQAAASRQFFDVKKQVVSFYDNLALVRELQSTVDGLHQDHGGSKGNSSMGPDGLLTRPSATQLSLLLNPIPAEERNAL